MESVIDTEQEEPVNIQAKRINVKHVNADRIYKKAKINMPYEIEDIAAAYFEVVTRGRRIGTVCKEFRNRALRPVHIPDATLRRYVERGVTPTVKPVHGQEEYLDAATDAAMAVFLIAASELANGLTRFGLIALVSHFLYMQGRCSIDHRVSQSWYDRFMTRHPVLSRRKAEALSRARAIKGERYSAAYFETVRNLFAKHEAAGNPVQEHQVYNLDESGVYNIAPIVPIM
jgi:hypothetical protein